ncbi:hypothetical protein CoNPh25_CDS0049 [Staphylococcus phage S-CoN_Ph25]|nr:hypothetical protein CoNPh25_CDS0049 [Staphylococcus phage S-CoN_Ph25]
MCYYVNHEPHDSYLLLPKNFIFICSSLIPLW